MSKLTLAQANKIVEVALAKAGCDGLLDDPAGREVRHRAFE